MPIQTLQLATPADTLVADRINQVLTSIEGVGRVSITPGTRRIGIDYEEGRTSPQELATRLQRAGIDLRETPKAGGGCCGSCGGQ